MRALGFGTKVLSVCFFAAALVMTMGLPWYGPAPAPASQEESIGELQGPLDGVLEATTRWFGEYSGTTGWAALGTADLVIAVFAALAALAALLASSSAAEHTARALLRGAVVVVLGATLLCLFDTPGDNARLEPRYGIFAAVAAAAMLAVSGFGLAEQRLRATVRRKPASYVAPPPHPEWQEAAGTSAPPPRA